MQREEAGDLLAFMVVAGEGSFTHAAAKLGTSQSALPGPIDGVTHGFRDPGPAIAAMSGTRTLGMTGKSCIHPLQLAPHPRSFPGQRNGNPSGSPDRRRRSAVRRRGSLSGWPHDR